MATGITLGDTVASRFRVLEELGRGAMGVVYRAHDDSLDREVALKTIRSDTVADPGEVEAYRERFLREAQTAAKLGHPNIVTIYDVGEWQGTLYMAIEYLHGVSLAEVLRNKKPIPPARALPIAIQMCQGLAEAHQHGVVHRDIKPANIMLIKNDEVRITDFGIAKVQSSATLTKEGSIVGTPSYMSPEQLSDQPVDGRSDIFALGAVLYEMLTGQRAFHGENVTTVILKVVTQDPEPAVTKNPELSTEITQVLAKALAKDPAARYQSVEDLEGDLRRLMAGMAPEAGPVPLASTSGAYNLSSQSGALPAPAPARSNRLLIGVSAVVALLVLVALVLVVMLFFQERQRVVPPPGTPTQTPPPATKVAPPQPPATSVAVLPFISKGGGKMGWLRSGLERLFYDDLAQSDRMTIIPPGPVLASAELLEIDLGKPISSDSIKKLGKALNVRTILTGSYDLTGKVIRMDIYLYEAVSGKILVTDYQKAEAEAELLDGVDNLTIRVRDAMGVLPDADKGDIDRDVSQLLTANMKALHAYLEGEEGLARKDHTASLRSFKEAIRLDPSFAKAHAELSKTYAAMGRSELEAEAKREAEERARQKAALETKQAELLRKKEEERLRIMRDRAEKQRSEELKRKAQAEEEARAIARTEQRTPATTPAPTESTPAPSPSEAVPTVSPGSLVALADLTKQPRPSHRLGITISSSLKRRIRRHGIIILSVLVNDQGNVDNAKVLRSDVPALNSAALESVRQWRFTPPEKDGVKVKAWFTVSMKV